MFPCQNDLCIYWHDERCTLPDISLDTGGRCQDCIFISLPEEELLNLRQKALARFAEQEAYWETKNI